MARWAEAAHDRGGQDALIWTAKRGLALQGSRGTRLTAILALAAAAWLQGCSGHAPPAAQNGTASRSLQAQGGKSETVRTAANAAERDCLIRAMYFESNRSSRDGLMAVGTVVMNRVASPLYPNTICGVVGEPRQFAPGVLTRAMNQRELALVESAADAVLRGERYAPVGEAMHFHMAGLEIPYRVRYVATAGGNAFYVKGGRRARETAIAGKTQEVATAAARPAPAPTETADAAAASGVTFLDRLYSRLASAAPSQGHCAAVAAGFGAGAFACDAASEGR